MTSDDLPYLDQPREPVPALVETPAQLAALAEALRAGRGPVAFDAERAHGHRYHPKAYLFQLRREGVGTALIDPIAFEVAGVTDLSLLTEATGTAEWIVHAASQDLPCMLSDRIRPTAIFDTELAARLLNYPGVGLAALVEHHFGLRLRKAHSADNWSTRPLPPSWLTYAALDVELLIELRELLDRELIAAGKRDWAHQEFSHILASAQVPPRVPEEDRWRRISGLRDVKHRRGLAVARALWLERESIAANLDRPTGRLLPDSGIVALSAMVADTGPLPSRAELNTVREFGFRGARRFIQNWLRAIGSVASLPRDQWPQRHLPATGPGHPRNWGRHHPEAAARWEATRAAVDERAAKLNLPPANLIQPAALREVVFAPPPLDELAARLAELGVRPWQIESVSDVLRRSLTH
ncbi:MAG: ribonuclease D [Propionibacteriaceae bacterium]|nr:ribonuclease D [Propionibacteriaceae bacterium]